MDRLKQLRKSKGMTQQELADLVGVTKGAVIHWEKYGFSSADKLQKLAGTFGVSISYLLDYDTNNRFSELITKVNEWAISHGLDKGNPKIEWMKVTEEVGEIRDVFLKPNDFADPEWSLKDAIGDSIVTLIVSDDTLAMFEPSAYGVFKKIRFGPTLICPMSSIFKISIWECP